MNDDLQAIFRLHSQPLEPHPTGTAPQLRRLEHIKAAAFDIYGTLVISGVGDIGVSWIPCRSMARGFLLAPVSRHSEFARLGFGLC